MLSLQQQVIILRECKECLDLVSWLYSTYLVNKQNTNIFFLYFFLVLYYRQHTFFIKVKNFKRFLFSCNLFCFFISCPNPFYLLKIIMCIVRTNFSNFFSSINSKLTFSNSYYSLYTYINSFQLHVLFIQLFTFYCR